MGKNKQTDPQLENISKLLDVFIDKFSIATSEKDDEKKRQIAFELLSCVCAFNVSPFYAKDNCWTAIKKTMNTKLTARTEKLMGISSKPTKTRLLLK